METKQVIAQAFSVLGTAESHSVAGRLTEAKNCLQEMCNHVSEHLTDPDADKPTTSQEPEAPSV